MHFWNSVTFLFHPSLWTRVYRSSFGEMKLYTVVLQTIEFLIHLKETNISISVMNSTCSRYPCLCASFSLTSNIQTPSFVLLHIPHATLPLVSCLLPMDKSCDASLFMISPPLECLLWLSIIWKPFLVIPVIIDLQSNRAIYYSILNFNCFYYINNYHRNNSIIKFNCHF